MRRSKTPLVTTSVAREQRGRGHRPHGDDPADLLVPKTGEHRPHAARSWLPFRVPTAHRNTTAVLGGAYPFLAGRPAVSGMFIGHDTATGQTFCFDPWELYARQEVSNTNIVIVGNIGWGKTNTAMAIAARGIAHGHHVIVPGDPKNDWIRLAAALGGQTIRLGPGNPDRLSPLHIGAPPPGADGQAWLRHAIQRRAGLLVAIIETLAPTLAPLHPEAHETLTAALDDTCTANATPTLPHLVTRLADQQDAGPMRAALAQLCTGPLAGMLDRPATATPDAAAPIIAVGTADVADNDTAHTLAVLTATSQLDNATTSRSGGGTGGLSRRFVIYDEAWRILATPAHLARVNSELRLARARGTATVLITHALSDSDKAADAGSAAAATAKGLTALCDTRIVFRQAPGETDRTATELHLTPAERDTLTRLGKGEALWRTGTTSRTIHTDLGTTEQQLFNTDTALTAGSI